jgi:DNA-binding transcriptional ArsR family regulator
MDKFCVIADPTRRSIIEILARNGKLSATEICKKFPVSPPAISQHLKILKEAAMLQVEKRAQRRIYQINPDALFELEEWAKQIRDLWSQNLVASNNAAAAEKGN